MELRLDGKAQALEGGPESHCDSVAPLVDSGDGDRLARAAILDMLTTNMYERAITVVFCLSRL